MRAVSRYGVGSSIMGLLFRTMTVGSLFALWLSFFNIVGSVQILESGFHIKESVFT